MKCFIGFLVGLGLSSMSITHAGDDKLDVVNTLQKTQFWGLVRPDQRCIEKYDFMPSSALTISSHKERATATYGFLENHQKVEIPALVISFKTDNKQPDCGGDSSDQAGKSTTLFLKKESDHKIYFCNDSLGQDCPVYLKPRSNFLKIRSGLYHVKQFSLKLFTRDEAN